MPITSSISSTVKGLLRRPRNIPFSSRTDRVAGIIITCPFSSSTNSTRSPAWTPSAARIRTGIVIWPLDVTRAAANRNPFQDVYSLHYSKELVFKSSGEAASHMLPLRSSNLPTPFEHLLALFRGARTRQHAHDNSRSLVLCVIHTLSGFHEVRKLRVRNVEEGLRIAVGEREP